MPSDSAMYSTSYYVNGLEVRVFVAEDGTRTVTCDVWVLFTITASGDVKRFSPAAPPGYHDAAMRVLDGERRE